MVDAWRLDPLTSIMSMCIEKKYNNLQVLGVANKYLKVRGKEPLRVRLRVCS